VAVADEIEDDEIVRDLDTHDDDVRKAIEELNLKPEVPEARVNIDKGDVPRDEQGKFASKPAETTPKRETLSIPDKKPETVDAQVAEVPLAPNLAPQAPKGLRPEFKAKFAELPPDWQAEITRRENDAAKVLAAQDEERLLGKKIHEMSVPYLPTIRAEGATVEKAFQDYLQTAHVLRSGTPQQKQMALRLVAQQFNVDLGTPPPQGQTNPQFDALTSKIAQLEGQLQGFTQQRQFEEQHSLQSQIEDFSTKPGHEHFDRVRVHMGVLLENGIAKDLEDAYNQAVYADPEIRSTLLAAQQQTQTGQRLTELNAKADRAKSAAVSVTGSPGRNIPLNGSGSAGSIEDDLRAAMREHMGRV
jgi:hypothetical protein